jgi:ABC-type polysaccharide/polyol phosphate transport system ATPase subunit
MANIKVRDLSKKFIIQHRKTLELKEKLVGLVKRQRFTREEFWALKNVSMHVDRGETVGLIGENGSGKTTLLKVIAKILEPDSGTVSVTGRVAAMLELGAGFNPNLTGRENIYLNSSILGFKKNEIRKKIKSIIQFSELEQFIDTPIKVYSSGMYVRLGFSVAVHLDPDILLIDEILAVGDESFQKKCMEKIRAFKEMGKTILYVSHALDSVRWLCDRVYLMNKGRVMTMGSADDVIRTYYQSLGMHEASGPAAEEPAPAAAKEKPALPPDEELGEDKGDDVSEDEARRRTQDLKPSRWGRGDVKITDVHFLTARGEETGFFRTGDRLTARIRYRCETPVARPVFGVAIYTDSGLRLNGPNTRFSQVKIKKLRKEGYLDYIIEALPLLPGEYFFTVAVYGEDASTPYDHLEKGFSFKVISDKINLEEGVVSIPCKWSVH